MSLAMLHVNKSLSLKMNLTDLNLFFSPFLAFRKLSDYQCSFGSRAHAITETRGKSYVPKELGRSIQTEKRRIRVEATQFSRVAIRDLCFVYNFALQLYINLIPNDFFMHENIRFLYVSMTHPHPNSFTIEGSSFHLLPISLSHSPNNNLLT